MSARNGSQSKLQTDGSADGCEAVNEIARGREDDGNEGKNRSSSRNPHARDIYSAHEGENRTPEIEPGEESYDPHFESLITQMITRLGENPDRDGLKRTPLRVAKALDFLTSGYTTDLETVVNDAVFEDAGQEMVLVKDIEFYSLCEHHMLPFYGQIHIAYIPNGKIIGLSKLARVADVFARRLQVQERLTNQIADALVEILEPQGVAVIAEAAHFCMMMRGVQKQSSTTLTSAMRGVFKTDSHQRDQLMRLIGK